MPPYPTPDFREQKGTPPLYWVDFLIFFGDGIWYVRFLQSFIEYIRRKYPNKFSDHE